LIGTKRRNLTSSCPSRGGNRREVRFFFASPAPVTGLFGAKADAAEPLENIGHEGKLDDGGDAIAALDREMARVFPALAAFDSPTSTTSKE
jgi:hypothetical protein